jgi:glycosyltransferase involved in cell wall biosynthesis
MVSIILPVYNGERFIAKAVESILNQTYRLYEFIIIDDGSRDATISIINTFHDDRIVLLQNSDNLGIVESLNKGIQKAKGEYICRMDADDISVDTRLEKQVQFLEDNKQIAVVGSQTVLIDENDREIGSEVYPVSPQNISKSIFLHNPFAHGSILIRASVFKECGSYDSRFIYNEDYDLWLRIGSKYLLANMPIQLLKRRIHDSNITVMKEIELVKFRLKTLHHALTTYYHNPFLFIYLFRPVLAIGYRVLIKAVRK